MITEFAAQILNDILEEIENDRISEILNLPSMREQTVILLSMIKTKTILKYLPTRTTLVLVHCALEEIEFFMTLYINIVLSATDLIDPKKSINLYEVISELKSMMYVA